MLPGLGVGYSRRMLLGYEWHDLLGNAGFLCIIGSYFWLQIGRTTGQTRAYSLVNALGAALILVSLYYEFNLSAVLVEVFWLVTSLLGLVISLRKPFDADLRAESKH
jgi:hypothetical protein